MPHVPLSVTPTAEDRKTLKAPLLEPSPVELDLLLHWPDRHSRPEWGAIFAASIAIHLLFFVAAIQLPSFAGRTRVEPHVIVRHIPLYLPPDVLTQKTPNRQKLSKSIDLADLLNSQPQQARQQAQPSRKRFELPKQAPPLPAAKNSLQILPEAPKIAINQTPGPLPSGSLSGIGNPAPPPPAPSQNPFQNIGSEEPPNPHPKLAPPKTNIQAAIDGLAQSANGRNLVISDDNPSEPLPATPGSTGQRGAQHSAVELQSDPEGADFKPYLRQILAIVRANWRTVIPQSARMGMLRGRTVLEFAINRDGSIPKLVIADSSGSQPLDLAAVAGLNMSRLPPLPSDYKGFQVRLAFSFAYNMPSQ